ncbi:aldehyde dehydrogenase family protein [Burkholderia sp. BCC0405]|uniref:aldehyde dehydrogenase family protein n=1 Tax=Burkholderia sp. BCC0405 TaxID=2676298 RepID=UPI001ABB9B93|nr:aldehyde dehydrogenase family protein [Burkholderia sp. BCC0405]
MSKIDSIATFDMFIGGQSRAPAGGEYFNSIDPSNGLLTARIARGGMADVDEAVTNAAGALREWSDMNPHARGKILRRVGEALADNRDHLAALETRDIGMPLQFASLTISGAADYFDFYGSLAATVQGETIPVGSGRFNYTLWEPYGVVAAIAPWNVPVNQAARCVAPALAAGNCVVLKPSEFSSMATVEMVRLANEAGLPAGVMNLVTGYGHEVGAALTQHALVEAITFTGSVATGRAIGKVAADRVVPVTLELGGKSPDIVFEDAKLEVAVPKVLMGFILNSGQICTSGTRVIVQRSIYEKFSAMLVAAAERIPIGINNPMPTLGPIANEMQFEKVMRYIEAAGSEGARLLTGGERASGPGLSEGFYVKPTIFGDVTRDMTIVREEIFGPVGVLIPFDTEEEAIEIANDTPLGLAAGVWSQDASRVHRVARRLQAGTVYINDWHVQAVEVPMGGYKRSGIGRERGIQAIKSYMQSKSVLQTLI